MRKTVLSYFPMNLGQSANVHAAFGKAESDLLIATDLVAEDSVDAGQFQRHAQQIRQSPKEAFSALPGQMQGHPVEGRLKLAETGIEIADGACRGKPGQAAVLPIRVLGARVKKEGLCGVGDCCIEDRNPHEKAQRQTRTVRRRWRWGEKHGLTRDIQGEVELGKNVHTEKAGAGLAHETGELFGRQAGVVGRNLECPVSDGEGALVTEALGSPGVNQPRLITEHREQVSL